MKTPVKMITLIFSTWFLLSANCSNENQETSKEKFIGMWNSISYTTEDGSTVNEQAEIFNSYFTGIEFFKTGEYLFFLDFENDGEFDGNTDKVGTSWEISSGKLNFYGEGDKMTFVGSYTLISITESEMQLKDTQNNIIIKFSRV